MENLISFDLEHWYDSEFIKIKEKNKKDFILKSLKIIVSLLDKHKTKASFFVTGEVLEKYPEEIKKLYEEEHEIASHSYKHVMLNKSNEKDIEKDLSICRKLIKKIIGEYPKGFRAPSWSISEENYFKIYKILEKLGFKYSSSLFPVNMGLYGSSKFSVKPFKPLKGKKFIEFPIRPFEIKNIRVPFSGGVYFRVLPRQIIKSFIKKINKENNGIVLYLHPWEFCPEIPKVKTNVVGKVTTYWGLKKNKDKLNYILSNFKFHPIKKALENEKL